MLKVDNLAVEKLLALPSANSVDMVFGLGETGCKIGLEFKRIMKTFFVGVNYNNDVPSSEYDEFFLLGSTGSGRDLVAGRKKAQEDQGRLKAAVRDLIVKKYVPYCQKNYLNVKDPKRVLYVTALGGSSGAALVEVMLDIANDLGWEIVLVLVMPKKEEISPELGIALTVLNGIISKFMTAPSCVKSVFLADNSYLLDKKFDVNPASYWSFVNVGIVGNVYELLMLPHIAQDFVGEYVRVNKSLDWAFNMIDEDEIIKLLFKGAGFYDIREVDIDSNWLDVFDIVFKCGSVEELKEYLLGLEYFDEEFRKVVVKCDSMPKIYDALLRNITSRDTSVLYDGYNFLNAKRIMCCCCIPSHLKDYPHIMKMVDLVFGYYNRRTPNSDRYNRTCVSTNYFESFKIKVVLGGLPIPSKINKDVDVWKESKGKYDHKKKVEQIKLPSDMDLLNYTT